MAPSILLVSDERGWPRSSGYRRRTAQTALALSGVGRLRWVVAPRNRFDHGQPLELPASFVGAVETVLVPAPTRSRPATLGRWASTGLPWPLAAGDWSDPQAELSRRPGPYDVLWAMGIDALRAARRAGVVARHEVVDLDLESLKLERQLAAEPVGRVRRWVARRDVVRWRRLEQELVRSVSAVSLCSEVEREQFGAPAWVVPNSYPDPGPVDRAVGEGGTLLFVGSLTYGPNLDGLSYFVSEVWPDVRLRCPKAMLRVVGNGLPARHWLREADGVVVADGVASLRPELSRAAAAVVPVRWGAGTRVKIVEAMAYRVPVVSSSLGAEGLEVHDGTHLLLADDPNSFGRACVSLLLDPRLGEHLAENAYDLFTRCYEQGPVVRSLMKKVQQLVASTD